jgi:dihydromethanopterin reductase (acceptor)
MNVPSNKRIAWAITGSGHYLRECLEIFPQFENLDLFLSKAAAEILQQYGYQHGCGKVYQDKTASAVPVGMFYKGLYDLLVIAPCTSNSVAKMVCGISDNLVTNLYAQAGKCRVPTIVFACDNAPALESEAPRENWVNVYPRKIDLENVAKLKTFESTHVVESIEELSLALKTQIQSATPSA